MTLLQNLNSLYISYYLCYPGGDFDTNVEENKKTFNLIPKKERTEVYKAIREVIGQGATIEESLAFYGKDKTVKILLCAIVSETNVLAEKNAT